MMTFVLIKRQVGITDKYVFEWWEKCGDKLYNSNGGWNFLISTDTIIETIEGKNWAVVRTLKNRKKTSRYQDLIDNSSNKTFKMGWLSPDGKMHYCEYEDHISYAHIVLESDVPTLENHGWLHIIKNMTGILRKNRITQAQAYTLKNELGIYVADEDIIS